MLLEAVEDYVEEKYPPNRRTFLAPPSHKRPDKSRANDDVGCSALVEPAQIQNRLFS